MKNKLLTTLLIAIFLVPASAQALTYNEWMQFVNIWRYEVRNHPAQAFNGVNMLTFFTDKRGFIKAVARNIKNRGKRAPDATIRGKNYTPEGYKDRRSDVANKVIKAL